MTTKIAVLGCGAWATTIANHLCKNNLEVSLWAYRQEIVDEINKFHIRKKVPQAKLEVNLKASISIKETLQNASAIILCVPSPFLDQTLKLWQPYFNSNVPILSLIKGIASNEEMLLTNFIRNYFKDAKIAVLSGPNLAAEIIQGKPAASVVAASEDELAKLFQGYLSSSTFRVYTSTDVIGVFYGGIVKNVIAIASGCCDGLVLGFNAKATLITRGLTEMVKIGMFMGAKTETFYGLSGLGDLVATAHSPLSRNYQYGYRLAKSQLNDVADDLFNEISEGVETTKKLAVFAEKNKLELPLIQTINKVLNSNLSVQEAIEQLMTRKLKEE